jgi:hypothetical protein
LKQAKAGDAQGYAAGSRPGKSPDKKFRAAAGLSGAQRAERQKQNAFCLGAFGRVEFNLLGFASEGSERRSTLGLSYAVPTALRRDVFSLDFLNQERENRLSAWDSF